MQLDSLRTIYNHDCRSMFELEDNSIQMCVTSPPYWGLRKYAGEQDLIWGNHNGCEHEWGSEIISKANDSNRGDMEWTTGGNPAVKILGQKVSQGNLCLKCGAWRGSYGLEPTPELYVAHTIEILNEIKRVLRKDGVCFWNIGDSYFASGTKQTGCNDEDTKGRFGGIRQTFEISSNILKPKDLCLIPFRVAIAAQEAGWWVRSVIIWSKNNPMPESVKDRPTESHEYILLLTKSSKYYWDMEAVREKSLWFEKDARADGTMHKSKGKCEEGNYAIDGVFYPADGGRNLRSVWTFPTQGYPEAHFATFPEELPERCIKAGSKEGDTVLDPFSGSGTTLLVAAKLGRKSVGYEISKEYYDLIIKRNNQMALSEL